MLPIAILIQGNGFLANLICLQNSIKMFFKIMDEAMKNTCK